ncbi:MAG TPA: MbcA/ParS/Xre antitoxin family protein [Bryobacteraceae bacterium]|jgi:putative toxin-antitoxin system antitoxin component (TIGR02293 family)|nr:MbcA/ParS/Xre antitoxin family protein [Bryobacteraceae bacterium]
MGNPSIVRLEHADFGAIVPVIAHAVAVFGDEHKATHWLSTPLEILEGRTPTEILQTPGGAARIETILTRIEHNIAS